jgi:hypothetical protein
LPLVAIAIARLATTVVLPSPPFAEVTAITTGFPLPTL